MGDESSDTSVTGTSPGILLVVDVVLRRPFVIVGVKRSAYGTGSVAREDSLCVSQKRKESQASLTQLVPLN